MTDLGWTRTATHPKTKNRKELTMYDLGTIVYINEEAARATSRGKKKGRKNDKGNIRDNA